MRESETVSSKNTVILDLCQVLIKEFPFAVHPPVDLVMAEEERAKAIKNMVFQKNVIILFSPYS